MATETLSGPLGELRAASTAGGGTALSTTPVCIALPDGARHAFIEGRNYSTAVVAQLAKCPYLAVLRTQDDLATATDYSQNAQDGLAATDVTLSSQGTAAQGDYLFVGSHLPFRGAAIDVDAANANAATLTVKYWTGSAWASISATDGTASAGASLAQDGTVTWTVPTDWAKAALVAINAPAPAAGIAFRSAELYWTRWEFSAALDSSTTLNSLLALSRSTAYFELTAGRVLELRLAKGVGGDGCLEARTDAGTANLLVNVAASAGTGFAS